MDFSDYMFRLTILMTTILVGGAMEGGKFLG